MADRSPAEVLAGHELAPWSDHYDWFCSVECGAEGSRRSGPTHSDHLCDVLRASGYAVTALPAPDEVVPATDDEHGVWQWWVTGGVVATFDSGVMEFDFEHYHGGDPARLVELAAALLAAVARCRAVGGGDITGVGVDAVGDTQTAGTGGEA